MSGRSTGIWGLVFTVLLLVSAGMATVPGGDDSVAKVRHFYDAHSGIVATAQVISLVSVIAYYLFAVGLSRSALVVRRAGPVLAGGLLICLAGVLTSVPPLWLCFVAGSAGSGLVHGLARASDLTDVFLFVCIGVFGAAVASATTLTWLRVVAAVTAALGVLRAIGILIGTSLLGVVAPVLFLVLVVALSILALREVRAAR